MFPDTVLLVDTKLLHDQKLGIVTALGRMNFDNNRFHFFSPGGTEGIRTLNFLVLNEATLPKLVHGAMNPIQRLYVAG